MISYATGLDICLNPYFSSKLEYKWIKAFLHIFFEAKSNFVHFRTEPIMFIVNGLHKALGLKLRKYLGFSAAELVDGLIQIGINDQNKKKVGE